MVLHKNTLGYCKPILAQQKALNAGRRCLYNHQCNSMKCSHGVCRGSKSQGEVCSKHQECNVMNACRRDVGMGWPFETRCRPYASDGELCDSDYDCGLLTFCSYASLTDKQSEYKRCLRKYSQADGSSFGWQDYPLAKSTAESAILNGRYCSSGWAFQSG
jgi:hypothetical protein